MNEDPRDEDERRMQALFDATATPPSSEGLQRMARRAAQIPEQHRPWYRKVPWQHRKLPWLGPVVGGVALAAAASVALYFGMRDEHPVAATGGAPTQSAELPVVGPKPSGDEEVDDLLAFDLDEDSNGDALDPDPLGGYEGADDAYGAGDHPVAALEVLFVEDEADVRAVEDVITGVLGEGG